MIWLVAALCYMATVERIIDGDTFVADVEMGLEVVLNDQRIRPLGIDTPEKWEPGGHEATEAVEDLMPPGSRIEACADRRDSFGRLLADVYVDGLDLAEWLRLNGHEKEKTNAIHTGP